MVEFSFDKFVQYTFPTFCSSIVLAVDQLSQAAEQPYSHGYYFVEIRRQFLTQSWVHRAFFDDMCEPIFTLVCKYDYLYIDQNFATFSTRRINDNFRTFSENLAHKWPGYVLSSSGHIFNSTDKVIHLD